MKYTRRRQVAPSHRQVAPHHRGKSPSHIRQVTYAKSPSHLHQSHLRQVTLAKLLPPKSPPQSHSEIPKSCVRCKVQNYLLIAHGKQRQQWRIHDDHFVDCLCMLLLCEQSGTCGLLLFLCAVQDLGQRIVWTQPRRWDMDMPRKLAGQGWYSYSWCSQPIRSTSKEWDQSHYNHKLGRSI